MDPEPFECKYKAEGGCEGKLHLGLFKGFICRKHLMAKLDELGLYAPAENSAVIELPEALRDSLGVRLAGQNSHLQVLWPGSN